MVSMNTSVLHIQQLSLNQIRKLYSERLKRDFPPDEIKPLARIERALARGEYVCYGAMEGKAILAYAFFVVAGHRALFDYFAVAEELRDTGIGSRFMRKLMDGPLSEMDCVLLEVDDPDCGRGHEEVALRNRRLAFYLRNGLADTGVRTKVYGVDFRILSLPVGHMPSFDETREVYAELYHTILPLKLYEKWVILCTDPLQA